MVLELVHLNIVQGKEAEFEAALSEAWKIIARSPGFVRFDCKRCMERPWHYILNVTWESLEDHMEGFRKSADFPIWRSKVQHFFDGPVVVEHFQTIHLV